MPSFSKRSLDHLETCDARIQKVLNAAIKNGPDFVVICGHRNEADQNKAFDEGKSKVRWPNGRHNTLPSKAVDIVPYPVDWNDLDRFRVLISYVLGIAEVMGVPMRSGFDWDGDWDEKDERFRDFPHLELKE